MGCLELTGARRGCRVCCHSCDRVGVNAEMSIKVCDVPGLAEVGYAEGGEWLTVHSSEEGGVRGAPSRTVTSGAARSAGKSLRSRARRLQVRGVPARRGRFCPRKLGDDVGRDSGPRKQVGGSDDLRHHRAHTD